MAFNVFPLPLSVPESNKKRLREKLVEHMTVGRYGVPVSD